MTRSLRDPAQLSARLLDIARQRGEDHSLLLNRFGLERLLERLGRSRHRDRFALKGALLFSLWYDQPHRPTRDADLLGYGADDAETMVATFREIAAIRLDDGIVFDVDSVRTEAPPLALQSSFSADPAKQRQWAAFITRNRLAELPSACSTRSCGLRHRLPHRVRRPMHGGLLGDRRGSEPLPAPRRLGLDACPGLETRSRWPERHPARAGAAQ